MCRVKYRLKNMQISGIFNDSSLFARFHQDSLIFNKKHRSAPFNIGSSRIIDLGMWERLSCVRVHLSCRLQPGNTFLIVIETIPVPVMRNSESTVNNLSYRTRFSCELAPVVEGLTKVVSMESSRPCAVPGTDFAAGNRGGGIIAVVRTFELQQAERRVKPGL